MCCLLVLDSVTSTPRWIRQPKPHDTRLDHVPHPQHTPGGGNGDDFGDPDGQRRLSDRFNSDDCRVYGHADGKLRLPCCERFGLDGDFGSVDASSGTLVLTAANGGTAQGAACTVKFI